MTISVRTHIHERYKNLFAVRAGYLPADINQLDPFFRLMADEAVKPTRARSVAAMAKLIASDPVVRMCVSEMIEQQRTLLDPDTGKPVKSYKLIQSPEDMLEKLDYIVSEAPWFRIGRKGSRRAAYPHFPMSALFTYGMMTDAGLSLFRNAAFNSSLTGVLTEWHRFLNSKRSLHVITPQVGEGPHEKTGWLAPEAYGNAGMSGGDAQSMLLWEFWMPDIHAEHWGFQSYNDFFHRKILDGKQRKSSQEPPEKLYPLQHAAWLANATEGPNHQQITNFRPVARPDDPRVIVSANDGQVTQILKRGARLTDKFWLKGNRYSLEDMLNGRYLKRFEGGSVIQSFLSGANYHRWHAPVDGVVRRVEKVEGYTFSESEYTSQFADTGTSSLVYEAAVNTRGLVFIESKVRSIGMVCVIPIGITEVSSVEFLVGEGTEVKKGDPLGYFSYGGSTLAIVFQRGAVRRFTVKTPDEAACVNESRLKVNQEIARAG